MAFKQETAADPDVVLIGRTLQGDKEAFETLVRRHQCRIYRTALGIVHSLEDAEEVLQDTFLSAYRHLGEFRRDSRFTTWLTRIAINAALNKLRGRKDSGSQDVTNLDQAEFMPRRCEPWSEDPERSYAREETRELVRQAIQELPPEYRVVLVLRDIAELDTVQTAEILELTIAATKSRLLRARLMVRESLAGRLARPAGWKSRWVRAGWMIRGMVAAGSVPLPRRKV